MSGGSQPQPDIKNTSTSGSTSGLSNTSSSGATTQTLSPEQQQLLGIAIPSLANWASNPPGLSNTVAGFNPTQIAGQGQVLGGVPGQQSVVGSGADASRFLTSGAALDPSTNPGLQGTIDAAVRPIYQNLTESVLPSIRSGAAVGESGAPSANYGGSRQGIAEGIAARGADTAAGDVAQKTAYAGYQSGLDAMTRALGLVPQTAGALSIPGLTTSAVGEAQQGQAQTEASAADQLANYRAMLPYLTGSTLAGIVPGLPGGGTSATGNTSTSGYGVNTGQGTSVGTAPQGPSTLQQILGGGSLAAGLLGSGGLSSLGSILPFI